LAPSKIRGNRHFALFYKGFLILLSAATALQNTFLEGKMQKRTPDHTVFDGAERSSERISESAVSGQSAGQHGRLSLIRGRGASSRPGRHTSANSLSLYEFERALDDWISDGEFQRLSERTIEQRRFIAEKLIWFCKRELQLTLYLGEPDDRNSPMYRHLGSANYCFVDGHVKWLKSNEVLHSGGRSDPFAIK
jgi:prepilin-type processing-associated H-X9-DG protein